MIGTELIANCLIYLAGILWGIDLVPQVIKTVKTKNVKGISIAFYFIFLSSIIYWII